MPAHQWKELPVTETTTHDGSTGTSPPPPVHDFTHRYLWDGGGVEVRVHTRDLIGAEIVSAVRYTDPDTLDQLTVFTIRQDGAEFEIDLMQDVIGNAPTYPHHLPEHAQHLANVPTFFVTGDNGVDVNGGIIQDFRLEQRTGFNQDDNLSTSWPERDPGYYVFDVKRPEGDTCSIILASKNGRYPSLFRSERPMTADEVAACS